MSPHALMSTSKRQFSFFSLYVDIYYEFANHSIINIHYKSVNIHEISFWTHFFWKYLEKYIEKINNHPQLRDTFVSQVAKDLF